MTSPASVSAVIVTHNRLHYLEQALASVAAQTAPPLEVVVVDDDSDQPVEQAFAHTAARLTALPVRFVRVAARCPGAARNAGAAVARGDILAFLDDDDLWEPDYLDATVSLMAERNAQCVLTWFDNFNAQGREQGKRFPPCPTLDELFVDNLGSIGSNLMLRRTFFLEMGGFDPELVVSEDKDLLMRLTGAGAPLAVLQRPLVLHRTDSAGGQISDEQVMYRTRGRRLFYEKHGHRVSPGARKRLKAKMDAMTLLWDSRPGTRLLALVRLLPRPTLLAGILVRLARRKRN